MFCAPKLVFGGAEGVGSRFHVLRSRTRFRRYRGRRVPFLCFARPNAFLAVPTASCPVFVFCAPGHVFGGAEGVGSSFHVLRSRTRFRRCERRRVPFSCFAFPGTFSAIYDGARSCFHLLRSQTRFRRCGGPGSRFHVLRSRTHFRMFRGRRVPFACFVSPYFFLAIPTTSGPDFIYVGSRTHFWPCGGRRFLFSCFELPDSFSAEPWASGLVFIFCAPELIFGGTDDVLSRFHVLHSRTRFRRCGGHRLLFSCFALPDSF
jgi:hypothetical protein